MAIKELFYDNRPQVLLDPRASQRIDPRFKFTRDGTANYVDKYGVLQTAATDQPRFEYDSITGEERGLLVEGSATNIIRYSSTTGAVNGVFGSGGQLPTGWGYAQTQPGTTLTIVSSGTEKGIPYVDLRFAGTNTALNRWLIQPLSFPFPTVTAGIRYASSCYAKLVSGSIPTSAFYLQFSGFGGPNGAYLNSVTSTLKRYSGSGSSAVTGTVFPRLDVGSALPSTAYDFTIRFGLPQFELGSFATSPIFTSGSEVTRAADLLSVEAPLPASGSVYIDARAIGASENDTLLSLKNSSNDKIDLAYLSNTSTYNSLALIANYDGTSKSSLPLPVPTTDRERNIITWGSQNYQYGRDSSRFATSLSSSVPTGLNKLSIGHDAVDPTKAFNGYINTVYAWSGELTPAVAEALVRNEIDAINADTYSPTGPAGALALVINTQGATASGEKTFTLPAESVANDNDIVITWGDGTESGLDGTDAEVGSAALTHTYPAAGIYPVWVEGQMQNIYFNNIANANDLLQIAAWGTGDMFTAPSTMANAFYGCTQMDFSTSARTTNRPDTSAVQNWSQAFLNCSSITGTFPAFNFSAATNFSAAWQGCSSMTSFVAAGDQTQNVTSFNGAWNNCSSLTSFPLINTSAGGDFRDAWRNCSSLTSFPLINTSAGTVFNNAWFGCSGLTSFPLINTAAGTNFTSAWYNCSSLTSFPLINTAAGTNFNSTWAGCNDLASFPLINTANSTNFYSTWYGCSSLTSFPLIDTSAGTTFELAWYNCSSLTSFPLIDTSAGTTFRYAWDSCSSLTSFPLIDTSSSINFSRAWRGCSSLTSFPALNFDAATGLASDSVNSLTGFRLTWYDCTSLATFPANLFDNTACTRYVSAFANCALTATSIENIIVSIEAAGTSNGNLSLEGGTNAGASTWTAPAIAAYDALVARGWTITRNA